MAEACSTLLKESCYKGRGNEICVSLVRVLGDLTFESEKCCTHLISNTKLEFLKSLQIVLVNYKS